MTQAEREVFCVRLIIKNRKILGLNVPNKIAHVGSNVQQKRVRSAGAKNQKCVELEV